MSNKTTHTSEVRADQAASKSSHTIKLGLDVHADTIVVVRILDNSTPQPAQRIACAQFLAWVKTQLALAPNVYSCYEAGPLGYVLHRQLTALGIHNAVVHPVCLDERRTGVNHDKSDALALAQRLDRYVAGNRRAMAVVRVPTEAQEQKRIQSRQREQLKREQKRLASQGRSLLLSQGFRQQGDWWKTRRWKSLQAELPAWLVERLEVFRRMLACVEGELAAATQTLEKAAPAQRPKGLGGLTSEVVEREVGDWNRFNNRRQVGSYTGLCGGVSASGNRVRLLSITKHGNRRLRTALIELAWRWTLWQPQCPTVKRWRKVLCDPNPRRAARKKAIVAVARQLAVDLWRWRTGRQTAQQLGWIMAEKD